MRDDENSSDESYDCKIDCCDFHIDDNSARASGEVSYGGEVVSCSADKKVIEVVSALNRNSVLYLSVAINVSENSSSDT